MAEDSLRSAIDAIRSRLHEELETQLAHLTARHADEVEGARRAAEADAEQRWSARVDEVRNEWTARLESEVANVRSDAERRMVAESTRLRVEAEQAAAERAAATREELERAVAEERSRAEQQLAEERSRAEQQLAGERSRLEEQIAAERSRAEEQLSAERTRADELRARLDEHSTERARLEEEGAAQRARFEAQALERARIEEQLAEERSRAEEHASVVQKHAQDLEAERNRAADLDTQRRAAEESAAEHRDRLSAERDELVRTLDAARHELAGLQGELDRVKQTLESATQERDGAIRDHEAATQHAIRLTSELSAEREKWGEDVRQREERDTSLAEARLAERQSQLAVVERVLTAIRAMDRAKSLSDVLASLTTSAAAEAPRVALFVVNGADLRGWKSAGFRGEASALHASAKDTGLLGEALRKRETVVTADSDGPAAPGFADLPAGRAGIAVPLLVGNQPVAVLYADDAADGTPAAPASWPEAIQILGRHASVTLAHLTAARAAEAMRRSLGSSQPAGAAPAAKAGEDGNSARRYARLLVSEIKRYNEAAVQIGRQKRDLLARLKPEIDRARKLYAQRISPAIDSRGTLFQQELVQTLADGDASLLGNPA
jgi:putative methionine-R-sulfoxide reductase with GAF domain